MSVASGIWVMLVLNFNGELAGFQSSRTITFALPKTKTKHALPPAITPRGSDMHAANGSWFTNGHLEYLEYDASVARLVSGSKLWIITDGNLTQRLLLNMKTFIELQNFLHIRTRVLKSKTYSPHSFLSWSAWRYY